MTVEANQKPLAKVSVVHASQKIGTRLVQYTGTLRPKQELDLLSETDGKVVEINFDLNQNVKVGQVLAKTNPEIKVAQHRIAEISYSKAKRDFERLENLHTNGNLSDYDLENARLQMQTAEQNMKLTQQLLNFTTIKSPISGTVTQKFIGTGKVLGPGSPIAVITDISELKLYINISPKDLNLVKVGDKIDIKIPDQDNRVVEGAINSISIQSTMSGTYPVELIVKNNNSFPIYSGLNATIELSHKTKPGILLIPRLALDKKKVWVVENGLTRSKSVVVGKEFGDEIEIISGISDGEVVIVRGYSDLKNGERVELE